jgi:hypothetical protein
MTGGGPGAHGIMVLEWLVYATGRNDWIENSNEMRSSQWFFMTGDFSRLEWLNRLMNATGIDIREERIQQAFEHHAINGDVRCIKKLAEITGKEPVFSDDFLQGVYKEKMLEWRGETLYAFYEFVRVTPSLEESTIQEMYKTALKRGLTANARFIKETTKIVPTLETSDVQNGLRNWIIRDRRDVSIDDERHVQRIQNLKEIIEFIGKEHLQEGLQACYVFCVKHGLTNAIEILMRETQISPELEDSVVQEGYLYGVENGIPKHLETLYALTKVVPTQEVIEESFELIHYLERIVFDDETGESGRGHMIPCEWGAELGDLEKNIKRRIGCKEILEQISGVKYKESKLADGDQIRVRFKEGCYAVQPTLKEPPEGVCTTLYCWFYRIGQTGFVSMESPKELIRGMNEVELDKTKPYSDEEKQFLQSFVEARDIHGGYGRHHSNIPFSSIYIRSILRKIRKILDQKTGQKETE